jgi:hypothetical protein
MCKMPFPFGLDEEWDLTDEGDHFIYTADPLDVPASVAARVIYELRKDCNRLNTEVMTLLDKMPL